MGDHNTYAVPCLAATSALRMWPLAFGLFYFHVAATTVERPMVRREVKDENVWGLKIDWCHHGAMDWIDQFNETILMRDLKVSAHHDPRG